MNIVKVILKILNDFAEQWGKDYKAMSPDQKVYFWQLMDRNRII